MSPTKLHPLLLTLLTLLVSTVSAYTNHTVGSPVGWFFNSTTNSSAANYSSWASSLSFSLGDYLIFRTNANQTVIQTYNETVYNTCDTEDAPNNAYVQYNGGVKDVNQPLTIAVPLTKEGLNYYLSDANDEVQCLNGMKFAIDVKHGQGLPPSLNQPPPPAYVEPPPGGAEAPKTVVVGGGGEREVNGGLRVLGGLGLAVLLGSIAILAVL